MRRRLRWPWSWLWVALAGAILTSTGELPVWLRAAGVLLILLAFAAPLLSYWRGGQR